MSGLEAQLGCLCSDLAGYFPLWLLLCCGWAYWQPATLSGFTGPWISAGTHDALQMCLTQHELGSLQRVRCRPGGHHAVDGHDAEPRGEPLAGARAMRAAVCRMQGCWSRNRPRVCQAHQPARRTSGRWPRSPRRWAMARCCSSASCHSWDSWSAGWRACRPRLQSGRCALLWPPVWPAQPAVPHTAAPQALRRCPALQGPSCRLSDGQGRAPARDRAPRPAGAGVQDLPGGQLPRRRRQ